MTRQEMLIDLSSFGWDLDQLDISNGIWIPDNEGKSDMLIRILEDLRDLLEERYADYLKDDFTWDGEDEYRITVINTEALEIEDDYVIQSIWALTRVIWNVACEIDNISDKMRQKESK